MPDAEQRKGQAAGNAGRTRAGAEPQRRLGGDQLGLGEDREAGRDHAAPDDHPQATRILRAPARVGADLQHLGGGTAFRVG